MAMEQFKKWWNKECDNDREIYPSSHDDCEDAWVAALNWANSNFKHIAEAIASEIRG